MKTNDLLSVFDIEANVSAAITAPKFSLKNTREACIARLEAAAQDHPVQWLEFCGIVNEYGGAITVSPAILKAAFPAKKAGEIWADVSARWAILRAISAKYVDTMGEVSADVNTARRNALFAYIRELFSYHGIALADGEISKRALVTIGEFALKYAFVGEDTAEAKDVGIATYIKTVIAIIKGYDSKEAAIERLETKASELASKAAVFGSTWRDRPYPACLTAAERQRIEDALDG